MRRQWLLLLLAACEGGGSKAPEDAALADASGSIPDAGVAGPPDGAPPPDGPPPADASPVTVAGRVVRLFGVPGTGIRIVLLDRDEVTVTDADGRFGFADVTPPYQLGLLDDLYGRVSVWEDLRRADPLLVAPPRVVSGDEGLERRGAVTGVAAPGFPSSGRCEGVLVVPGASSTAPVQPSSGGFTFDAVRWHGPAEVTATAHVLHWTSGVNDLPASYEGYGTTGGIVVRDGELTEDVSVAMNAVTWGSVTVAASVPSGYASPSIAAYLGFDGGGWITLGGRSADSVTFVVPDLAGARVRVRGQASRDGATVAAYAFVAGGDVVTLGLPAAPELLAPADGAVDVGAGTVFSWRPYPGMHLLTLYSLADGPWITVLTRDASAALPDLSPWGLAPPSGARYSWGVTGVGGFATIDELSDPAGGGLFGTASSSEGTSTQRTFLVP